MNEHDPRQSGQSESQFLAAQSRQAKAAISRMTRQMGQSLLDGVDPRTWARAHPWATLSTVAGAGLAAAWLLVPSREQQTLRKLERIERALHPAERQAAPGNAASSQDAAQRTSHSRLGRWTGRVFSAVRPALWSALSAGISAKISGKEQRSSDGSPESAVPNSPAAAAART